MLMTHILEVTFLCVIQNLIFHEKYKNHQQPHNLYLLYINLNSISLETDMLSLSFGQEANSGLPGRCWGFGTSN